MKKAYITKSPLELLHYLQVKLPELLPTGRIDEVQAVDQDQLRAVLVSPDGQRHTLRILVRALAVPSRLRDAAHRVRQEAGEAYPVVAGTFLSPRGREVCREASVGYLDLAGNCRLALPGLHLERVVERNPFPARGRPASLFAPVSSRIVRAMLEEPQRSWQISELAAATGVSLGQTSNVCQRLRSDTYADLAERRVVMTQPGRLLDAWQQEYAIAKHRALFYYSFERTPEAVMTRLAQAAQATGVRLVFTGFSAAGLLAPHVRGAGVVQAYVEHDSGLTALVAAAELQAVDAGPNVMALIPVDAGVFYRSQQLDGLPVVGPVQAYLDLVGDPARGREQAAFLRAQLLRY